MQHISIDNDDKNFKFAAGLIKIIAVVIALMILVISRYAFIFFIAAMLPTICVIFFDRNAHRCLSATICSFNLIGVIPYLIRIWEANYIDHLAQKFLGDITTWLIIYGATFVGLLIYFSIPVLVVRMHSARFHMKIEQYKKHRQELCHQWGIEE